MASTNSAAVVTICFSFRKRRTCDLITVAYRSQGLYPLVGHKSQYDGFEYLIHRKFLAVKEQFEPMVAASIVISNIGKFYVTVDLLDAKKYVS